MKNFFVEAAVKIKTFFTPAGWKKNWKDYIIGVVFCAVVFVAGAFGGAAIQAIKDALK